MTKCKFVVVLLLVLLDAGVPAVASQVPEGSFDPLQHCYLVVRAKIVGLEEKLVSTGDWGVVAHGAPGSESLIGVWKVRVEIHEVLKGRIEKSTDALFADFSFPGNDVVGREFIVGANWRELPAGGEFIVGSYLGVYERNGADWSRRIMDSQEAEQETLSDAALRERVRMGTVEAVTEAADVVARVTIIEEWLTRYEVDDRRSGVMHNYRLIVNEPFKGSAAGDSVTLVIPGLNASFVPEWYRAIGFSLDTGDELYVFLQESDRGLQPFSGPNSLLKIVDGKVTFEGRIPLPEDPPGVERRIRDAIE